MSEPASQRLRVVIAGLGVMGGHHLRVTGALADAEVVAVADPSAERREAALQERPGVAAHASLGEALAAHELDVACLAAPVDQLPELAHEALAAGLHVLVEKPTAPTEEQALALGVEASERGLVLGVGHVERFNPAVVALRTRIEEGAIGRLMQMHARRLSPYPNRHSTHGVALDLATHDIDVMRYVGGSEIARVYAETARHAPGGAEDLLCATLRFDDGATGLLEVNWLTPTKVRQLTVTGERGMFVVDYLTQDLTFYEHPTSETSWGALAGMRGPGEGDMVRYALQRREPLRVEWEAFLAAVRAGGPAPVGAEDGAAALSTARAIQAAGERHEVVVPSYREARVG